MDCWVKPGNDEKLHDPGAICANLASECSMHEGGRQVMISPRAIIKFASAFLVLIAGLLLLASSGPVLAEEPTEEQIFKALQPKQTREITRSLTEQRRSAEERRILDGVRTRSARSLSLGDRAKISEIAKDKPSIDIEINFDYNSDVVGSKAMQPLLKLGRVLSNDAYKGTIFLLNGHTDAKGGLDF